LPAERSTAAVTEPVYQPPLTAREKQVAELLLDGKTSTQIAEALAIGPNTARNAIGHIYEKLGIHNRNELTRDHLT
jgi:DNA-binding CsgD family transcriptional regulator